MSVTFGFEPTALRILIKSPVIDGLYCAVHFTIEVYHDTKYIYIFKTNWDISIPKYTTKYFFGVPMSETEHYFESNIDQKKFPKENHSPTPHPSFKWMFPIKHDFTYKTKMMNNFRFRCFQLKSWPYISIDNGVNVVKQEYRIELTKMISEIPSICASERKHEVLKRSSNGNYRCQHYFPSSVYIHTGGKLYNPT